MPENLPTNKTGQLALPLPSPPPLYLRRSFIPPADGPSPLAAVDLFVEGEEPALVIIGPDGSGKTFLGRLALGALLDRRQATSGSAPHLRPLFVDDLHLCDDPQFLLELIESNRQSGVRLILSGRGDPADWAKGLRDLQTRLAAMPRVRLDEPDETQVEAILRQAFADRQMRVAPSIISYAAVRLPARCAALHAFVAAAEREVFAAAAPLTIGAARRVLAALTGKLDDETVAH